MIKRVSIILTLQYNGKISTLTGSDLPYQLLTKNKTTKQKYQTKPCYKIAYNVLKTTKVVGHVFELVCLHSQQLLLKSALYLYKPN